MRPLENELFPSFTKPSHTIIILFILIWFKIFLFIGASTVMYLKPNVSECRRLGEIWQTLLFIYDLFEIVDHIPQLLVYEISTSMATLTRQNAWMYELLQRNISIQSYNFFPDEKDGKHSIYYLFWKMITQINCAIVSY